MSAADDLLERMRAHPTSDWRLADIEKVCRAYGVDCDPPPGGGSHYKLTHPSQRDILAIPFRRRIKRVYIGKFVRSTLTM